MSLFKVRDFWSFDLEQLRYHTDLPSRDRSQDGQQGGEEDGAKSGCLEGSYAFDVGRFDSISRQEVFVCANLNGYIDILQVPSSCQRKLNNSNETDGRLVEEAQRGGGALSPNLATTVDRQLLASSQLGTPIVDIKCGYFNSALKQTIAVLSFDQILILQVKRKQVDLLSLSLDQTGYSDDSQTINETLLSHELRELYRLELPQNEIACGLHLLDSHADSRLTSQTTAEQQHDRSSASESMGAAAARKFAQKTNQIVQQLHLPQRDKLVVQYTDQFLFTLVDSKKILGHFRLKTQRLAMGQDNPDESVELEQRQQQQHSKDRLRSTLEDSSHHVGPMPMGYLYHRKASSLVVSLSDYKLYNLSLEKLISQAKQNIMKRVAQNLLVDRSMSADITVNKEAADTNHQSGGDPSHHHLSNMTTSQGSRSPSDQLTEIYIDLDSFADWTAELVNLPLQIVGLQRRARDHSLPSQQDELVLSQLLVMSRYNLESYSHDGHQLWSLRYETPLVHLHAYTVQLAPKNSQAHPQTSTTNNKQTPGEGKGAKTALELQPTDRMICLLCSDTLAEDKSNLIVLEEEREVWSASLGSKPMQLMRVDLESHPGFLVSLDARQSQLTVSYLGTSSRDDDHDDGQVDGSSHASAEDDNDEGGGSLLKLKLLDDPQLAGYQQQSLDIGGLVSQGLAADIQSQKASLMIETRLEATNQWPNIVVNSCTSFRCALESTSVLHNIVATLEFDDLIEFHTDHHQVTPLSRGVVQVQLGNCWPDRREPILLRGSFKLASSKSSGVGAIDRVDQASSLYADLQSPLSPSSGLLPKSLEIRLYVRFSKTNSGTLVQKQSFLLPLSMISRLAHIDFSSGQNQQLDDVLANLQPYYRRLDAPQQQQQQQKAEDTRASPCYYLCDLFLKIDGDILDIIDDVIEGDLVCRGLDGGGCGGGDDSRPASAMELRHIEKPDDDRQRKLLTLENINLLAQSLDCRLKFKTSACGLERQLSGDQEFVMPVMVSIALKVNHMTSVFGQQAQSSEPNAQFDRDAIVWIHVCDLTAQDSNIPQDFVKMHLKEWKKYSEPAAGGGGSRWSRFESKAEEPKQPSPPAQLQNDIADSSILISIESDHPLPVLFFQGHLLQRFRSGSRCPRVFNLDLMAVVAETAVIELNHESLLKFGNFTAISSNLHDEMKRVLDQYNRQIKSRYTELKDELEREQYKYSVATAASISMAKRLHNVPDEMIHQFRFLSALTKQYQLNLLRILTELDQLKRFDYEYTKIPSALNIKVEESARDGQVLYKEWPDFSQITD